MTGHPERIWNVDVTVVSRPAIVADLAARLASSGATLMAMCANPHSLCHVQVDPTFGAALACADYVVPDGVGIVLASRVLGGAIRERVTGTDFFLGLSRALNDAGGHRYFFLGATERTLELIEARCRRDFPRIAVVGTLAPPFKKEFTETESGEMLDAIDRSGADILWVGMTAPKQEKWLFLNRARLRVRLAAAIGGAFDFYAGTVHRAGPGLQALGLEWLPRLLREPSRLWRRTLMSAPVFLWHVLLQRVRATRGRTAH